MSEVGARDAQEEGGARAEKGSLNERDARRDRQEASAPVYAARHTETEVT